VASLGLVKPGAATDGVTLFFWKNWLTFSKVISLWKLMTFFRCCLVTTPIFPCRLSSVLSKFSHKKTNFIRLSPGAWIVSPGAVPPPHRGDATDDKEWWCWWGWCAYNSKVQLCLNIINTVIERPRKIVEFGIQLIFILNQFQTADFEKSRISLKWQRSWC